MALNYLIYDILENSGSKEHVQSNQVTLETSNNVPENGIISHFNEYIVIPYRSNTSQKSR
jgi:hypothetical protein